MACYACVTACKMKHGFAPMPKSPPEAEPGGLNLLKVYKYGPVLEGEQPVFYHQPVSCLHCEDAPCIRVCPRSAIYKEKDYGITLVDEKKCIGCRFCLWVCPYGAPGFDEKGKL